VSFVHVSAVAFTSFVDSDSVVSFYSRKLHRNK